MRKPYYKRSHQSWYVNLDGKQVRLGPDRHLAFQKWEALTTPVGESEVADAIKRFIDGHPRWKPATRAYYKGHLKRFEQHVGAVRVRDLRQHHLTTLLDRYAGQNHRHNIAQAVTFCFRWLADEGLIERTPFKRHIPAAVARGDEAYIPRERLDRIIEAAEGDFRDILIVLRETGCRPKEARLVEARHLQDHLVVFEKVESKGGKCQRVIHLSPEVFQVLRRLALKYPTGPLLRDNGRPWTAQALASKCEGFTPYQLRHTFATNAILKGVDLQTIAVLMGHTGLKMLSKVYSHVKRCEVHLRDNLAKISA